MRPPADAAPQGDPERVVDVPGGGSLVGLQIKGLPGPVMISIREDHDGVPLACAITKPLPLDTSRMQSNPRRYPDPGDQT